MFALQAAYFICRLQFNKMIACHQYRGDANSVGKCKTTYYRLFKNFSCKKQLLEKNPM